MPYDHIQIARELQETAQADAYHGNALYVARDMPELTNAHKQCLSRWLDDTNTSEDRFTLQDIVIIVRQIQEVTPC